MTDKKNPPFEDGPKIMGVLGGGSISHGEQVSFTFGLEGGNAASFHTDFGTLPQILTALQAFGRMTMNDRQKRPAGTNLDEIVSPYHVTKMKVGTSGDGEHLVLQVGTHLGVPIVLAMTRSQAQEMTTLLQKHLASDSGQGRRPH
ncbi:hypothetical protein [Nisaea sp.]|uniref:hypothetical protein n=1 Tax=Nisaea sp. TaxID=2024842 RepID=UPI003B52CBCB